MRVCVCVFLSVALSRSVPRSSDMLTAHSAGLISLLMLCESRLINTHLWQISTANCDRHSASSRYLIISAWRAHSKQRSLSASGLPLALSLRRAQHTRTAQFTNVRRFYCFVWGIFGIVEVISSSWLAAAAFLLPLIAGLLRVMSKQWCLRDVYLRQMGQSCCPFTNAPTKHTAEICCWRP